jgi:penicillin-binding protein 1A
VQAASAPPAKQADNKQSLNVQALSSAQLPAITYLQAPQVLDIDLTIDMANMLRDVIQAGSAMSVKAYIERVDIGGKTGTTNNNIDAWFAGFHPSIAAVTWLGFDKPSTLGKREYGGVTATPIWANFMAKQLADQPYKWLVSPGRIDLGQKQSKDPTAEITAAEREAERLYIAKRAAKLRPPMVLEITAADSLAKTQKPSSQAVAPVLEALAPQASTEAPSAAVLPNPKAPVSAPPPQ